MRVELTLMRMMIWQQWHWCTHRNKLSKNKLFWTFKNEKRCSAGCSSKPNV